MKRRPRCAQVFVLAALLCVGPSFAAKPKPDPNAEVRTALQAATTIYVLPQDQTGKLSPDFLTFFNGLQATSRFRFVPSGVPEASITTDSELDLLFLDPTPLAILGYVWTTPDLDGTSKAPDPRVQTVQTLTQRSKAS